MKVLLIRGGEERVETQEEEEGRSHCQYVALYVVTVCQVSHSPEK